MKKINLRRVKTLFAGLALSLFFTSCYNKITEEVSAGDIPIQIKTNIDVLKTRMSNNHFENKDAIGLFLILKNTSLSDSFLKNILFEYNESNVFTAKSLVYYPKQENPSKILAYYPYNKDILMEGSNSLKISVGVDQNRDGCLDLSDFLIAETDNVYPKLDPVDLTFKHKNTKLLIYLKPTEGYTIDEIAYTKPVITLHEFPTEALLNTENSQIESFSNYKSINPYTHWVIDKDKQKLTGCEVVLLPQDKCKEGAFISLEAENITYTCAIPKNFTLNPGTINELTIYYNLSKGIEITDTKPNVSDWELGVKYETNTQELLQSISINKFNFENSNVCQLINSKGQAVAEVCKEYLRNEVMDTQAIVYYPLENSKPQLEKGILLKRLGANGGYDGGAIKWDMAHNSFVYEEPIKQLSNFFYITTDGKMTVESSTQNDILHIQDFTLKDKRADELKEYTVTKIGTQYWLKDDFIPNFKLSGEPFAVSIDKRVANAGYVIFSKDPNIRFYNTTSLESEELAPEGWSIPAKQDFNKLITYVNEESDLLKADMWNLQQSNSNITGFSANNWGIFRGLKYFGESAGYWSYDPNTKMKFNVLIIQDKKKEEELKQKGEKGLEVQAADKEIIACVRCLRNL